MHTTDSQKLKALVDALGEQALEKAAVGSRVSASTISRLIAGTYGRVPRSGIRERLSEFFGVPVSELFPPVSAGRKKAS